MSNASLQGMPRFYLSYVAFKSVCAELYTDIYSYKSSLLCCSHRCGLFGDNKDVTKKGIDDLYFINLIYLHEGS